MRLRFLPPVLLSAGLLSGTAASGQPTFKTAPFGQMVRSFYTNLGDAPIGPVDSVCSLSGRSFASSKGRLLTRLTGPWTRLAEAKGARALLTVEDRVLVGGSDGVGSIDGSGKYRMEAGPKGVFSMSLASDGVVWAINQNELWKRASGWSRVAGMDSDIVEPRGVIALQNEDVFVLAANGLHGLLGKRKYLMRLEVAPNRQPTTDIRAAIRFGPKAGALATAKGLCLTDFKRSWTTLGASEGLPVLDLTCLASAPDGTLWIGTADGLVRWRGGKTTFFAGPRWLPSNLVTSLAVHPHGTVMVGTHAGTAEIGEKRMTLEEKAAFYQKELESRPRRHGYVTLLQLKSPGVLDGALQEVSDNDGSWTSLYGASQAFRYFVTKDPAAKAQAWKAMEAMLRLESITGLPGFPARAICHKDEPQLAGVRAAAPEEWHESPVEKGWFWKGDTSSDEIDAHYYAWYVYHETAATDEEKARVRETCRRVTDHILKNGYHLVDRDGKPTTWGVWAPEKLNDDPKWWEERGLNSLEILSHLKVAHHIVGDPRYEKAYRDLIDNHRYALNTIGTKIPDGVSHDDELAFFAYYPLLRLEKDPQLRGIYLEGLRRLWQSERLEESPVWNFWYGGMTGEPCEVEAAVKSLQEMPLDMIHWPTRNSHRLDIPMADDKTRPGGKRLQRVISWIERPMGKWDKDPFFPDGGDGRIEEDQTVWLHPYWLGRYHRIIE